MQAFQKIGAALDSLRQELEVVENALVDQIKVGNRRAPLKSSKQPIYRGQDTMQPQQSAIAIIGMASIFPKAETLQDYWENIIGEVDCITDVPASHWNIDDYYDPNPRAPDKTYCKRGGFIPDIDFNPMEFGLPPNLLESTDVSQILSLVVAKKALEDAGYGPSRSFDRELTGVVLGAVSRQLGAPLNARLQYPIWKRVLNSCGLPDEEAQNVIEKMKAAYIQWEESSFPGLLSNVIAGRIANRFDFGGINCTVDAACASSLSAFNMAISELIEHRANMMLVGGVDTDNSAFTYLCFSKTPALSRSQQTRPFDAESDGMMLGEGLGMVVLKRLEDAERDRATIYAVIKGIGTSSDGRYKSIYAPRSAGQVKALRRAYQNAGIAPASVGLIEAHGTGTMAGDPAEFEALNEVFSENNPAKNHIALGSVKSQIGHTKTAAGVASLIKAALALHHKILPPTINIQKPHPKLGIESSPFYLSTKTRPWLSISGDTPRRAGISSFGFGGTNFHIVLEEYQMEHHQPYRLHRLTQPILLFAEDPKQLVAQCETTLQQLYAENSQDYYAELVEASKSPDIPLPFARLGYIAADLQEACSKLKTAIALLKSQPSPQWEHPQGIYYRASGVDLKGKVVALFPGQGSQYVEMGRELTLNLPELRQVYRDMDRLMVQDGLQPLSQVVFPPPVFEESERDAQSQQLQKTEYAQPALGAFSVGLYKVLQQAGFTPDFVAGHSFGELTALWAAGALSYDDYCLLVKRRGQAMSIPPDSGPAGSGPDYGTMLAVKGDAHQIESIVNKFPKVNIANFNSNQQVVLAGTKTEILNIQHTLGEQSFSTISLSVAAAFHTPLVAHAQKPFAEAVRAIAFHPPQIPVYTNVNGKRYTSDPKSIQKTLKEHLINSVQFKQEIEQIYADGGYCFVEIGPRNVLTNLVKNILGDHPHLAIALNGSRQKDSDRQLREALVQLKVAGIDLNLEDSYALKQPMPEPESDSKKKLTVRLNASGFVSEKTRRTFEEALQEGVRLTASCPQAVKQKEQPHAFGRDQPNGSQTPPSSLPAHSTSKTPSQTPQKQLSIVDSVHPPTVPSHAMSAPRPYYQHLLESMEQSLAQFHHHQSSTVQLHQQYLSNQLEYSKIFFHLMQQQNELLLGQAAAQHPTDVKTTVIQSLERNMMRFHDHQAETLRAHEQSIDYQAEHSRHFFQLIQHQHQHQHQLHGTSKIDQATATIDTTVSVQPLSSSRSAASGIDFTSQPAVSPVHPPAYTNGHSDTHAIAPPASDPAPSANGAAASYAASYADAAIAPEPRPVPEPVAFSVEPEVATPVVMDPDAGAIAPVQGHDDQNGATAALAIIEPSSSALSTLVDLETLSQTLLEVVSDKTGYPPEMLEMDMDMEADLGIDSIKRVEIMGAMMDAFPELPQPDLEELAELELRTLNQIAAYMEAKIADGDQRDGGIGKATLLSDEFNGASSPHRLPASPEGEGGGGATPSSARSPSTGPAAVPEALSTPLGHSNGSTAITTGFSPPRGNGATALAEPPVAIATAPPEPSFLQFTDVADGLHRAEVRLQPLLEPDWMDIRWPDHHVCLITDDGSQTTASLVSALVAHQWQVAVLSFPSSVVAEPAPLPERVTRYVLNDLSEIHLQQTLGAIAKAHGTIAALIHLNPVLNRSAAEDRWFSDTEAAIVREVFCMAKHLKESLTQAAAQGFGGFFTVARLDGAFGLESGSTFGPIGAGLFGLTKSLNAEWKSVVCRALDLHPKLSAQEAVRAILSEVHDPNRYITEVAYGPQGRTTLTTESE